MKGDFPLFLYIIKIRKYSTPIPLNEETPKSNIEIKKNSKNAYINKIHDLILNKFSTLH